MKAFFGLILSAAGIIVLGGAILRQFRLSLFGIQVPPLEFFAGVILLSAGVFMVIWEVYRD